MSALTVGSLFSGIGGFDLGLERAGVRPLWMCEIDRACQGVLRRHWPGVPIYDDVTRLSTDNLVRPDVLCGGFPCQDVSVAGRRAGLVGERSGLWYEFLRVIESLRPRWVVIENVPGLLSSNGGRDFAVVLRGLVECGYGVTWRVLDAQYFGVAQRRRRVFIVGSLGSGRAAEVLFERESLSGHPTPRREAGAHVARSLANSSVSSGYRYDPNGEEYVVDSQNMAADYRSTVGTLDTQRRGNRGYGVVGTLTATYAEQSGNGLGETENGLVVASHPISPPLTSEGHDGSEDGRGRKAFAPVQRPPLYTIKGAANGRAPENGPQYGEILDDGTCYTLNTVEQHAVAALDPIQVTSKTNRTRVEFGAPCDTLHGKGMSAIGGFGVRRLTPIECERLQGFPDSWTAHQSDSTRYRQLGNAVCVNVAEWIGRRIMEADTA